MPKARTINWESLIGALKRLPDSDLSELLSTAKAKLLEIGLPLDAGKPAVRMGGPKSGEGDCYNHRSVLQWIASAEKGRMPRAVDATTKPHGVTRWHLANLYATLVARGVKEAKPPKED